MRANETEQQLMKLLISPKVQYRTTKTFVVDKTDLLQSFAETE